MRKWIFLIILAFGSKIYAQDLVSINDTCLVIRALSKKAKKNDLTESYSPNGLYLLKNGIYDIKVKRESSRLYRIIDIKEDSISVALTMNDKPVIKFHVNDITKITFPSMDDGRVAFPQPSLHKRSYKFEIVSRNQHKLPYARICQDKDCQTFINGCWYITSGRPKPIYKKDGINYIITETLQQRNVHVPLDSPKKE